MKIKKKQSKAIGFYVRTMADLMGLRDWTVSVELLVSEADLREEDRHDGDSDVWGAACAPVRGRKYARIMFGLETLTALIQDDKRDEFRQTVCHELLHCHFAPLWEQIRTDLYEGRHLPQAAYDIFIDSAERNMEYGIDAAAVAWAESLPKIDWNELG